MTFPRKEQLGSWRSGVRSDKLAGPLMWMLHLHLNQNVDGDVAYIYTYGVLS